MSDYPKKCCSAMSHEVMVIKSSIETTGKILKMLKVNSVILGSTKDSLLAEINELLTLCNEIETV